jgi:hypothetical protein
VIILTTKTWKTTKTTKGLKSLSNFVVFVVFVVEKQIRNEENLAYSILVSAK